MLTNKNKAGFWGILVLLAVAQVSLAQTVSTLSLSNSIQIDGMAFNPAGQMVATSAWNGTYVSLIDLPSGQVSSLSHGLAGPIEVAIDAQGNSYLTNWNSNRINKITPDGTLSLFVTVPRKGDGVEFATNGDLWHTNGTRDEISIISPNGDIEIISSGDELGYPLGIALADDGQMYISGARTGQIWRMSASGAHTLVATVPSSGAWRIGHIEAGEGCLYASGLSSNKIFRISLAGEVTTVAGTGVAGTNDGSAEESTFNFPNGLVVSPDGQKLYVTSGSGSVNYIRVIELASVSAVDLPQGNLELRPVSPNPFNPRTVIPFALPREDHVRLTVTDIRGARVATLVDQVMAAGNHQIPFNGTNLASGVYLYQLETGGQTVAGKMTLTK